MEERENFLADIREWEKFQLYKQAFEKFKRVKDVRELTLDELIMLEECDFEPPKWKYNKELYPTFAMVLDDDVDIMTKTIREQWKEAILRDYPRLREVPQVVETLMDAYEADPEGFKRGVKRNEKRASKKEEATKPVEEYDPSKFTLTCISKGTDVETPTGETA
eukprot:gene37-167_t